MGAPSVARLGGGIARSLDGRSANTGDRRHDPQRGAIRHLAAHRRHGTAATQQNADNATDQQWRFVQQTSGYFKIFNVAGGKVLGVQNQSTADGAKILQWDDNGTLDHEWAVAPHPPGGYTLTNRITGKNLDIPGASTATGTAAQQYQNSACLCQLFAFQSAGGGAWTPSQKWTLADPGNGYYKLRNVNSSLAVDDQLWKIVRVN
ncbi:RICIN domain-containing protein [Streptomyces canus]|uniref:RICIN domain-containing protein n=1 Tax=Streptomyces canus TaxID=58343 RepID=UPI0027D7D1EF|nr:RICIN domain-containing protein [Streptomyces canus]